MMARGLCRRAAQCAIAIAALAALPAFAEPTPCPSADALEARQLYGLWHADVTGVPRGATLLLEHHPELADSVRGAVNRNGDQALVAGDVDEGLLTLEESIDGQHIDATWIGQVVDGSCGKEIRGTWTRAHPQQTHDFVLRKISD